MKNAKLSFILIACLILQVEIKAQNNYKGFLPDNCSYTVLSQPSVIQENTKMVYGNTFRFPFLMTNGTMVLLSNDEIKDPVVFSLPDEIKNCEDAFFLDDLFICKNGNVIKNYNGKKVKDVLRMADEHFNIYPANDKLFYLVKHHADSSSVFVFELTQTKFTKLFVTPFLIDNIAGSGKECFVTSGEMIYFVSDEICTLVEVADSKVQSIDFFSDGAFYSTENACCYLGLPGKSYPFLLGDIKQVMLVDNRLYLLFRDGLLSVIDNANQYQTLLDKVMNEVNKNEDEKH